MESDVPKWPWYLTPS